MFESPLENLPDELILNILGYVKIQDLINCGQTSKRIRSITHDETLWQRVDGGFQLDFLSISRVIIQMLSLVENLSLKKILYMICSQV